MSTTAILQLPYIVAAQAQKHVTHNEAIRMLDAIVQIGVVDRDLTAPPSSPAEGDRYIVAAGATGDWADRDTQLAIYQDGAWAFFLPREGWLAWLTDENALVTWNGADWISATGEPVTLNPTPLVGVNATADATNRLAVASPGSLFDNEGNGHQQKINKAASGDTASVMFQVGYSGRVEVGLTGDDKLHIKTSPDGAVWSEAMVIDPATGYVGFGGETAPEGPFHVRRTSLHPVNDRADETTSAPVIVARKSRGSFSARTALAVGDVPQAFFGQGYDGTNFIGVANCRWVINGGAVSAGNIPTKVEFWTFKDGSGGHSSKFEISHDGIPRPASDNTYSLGDSTNRWSSVWAANGTIQTSDARDKDVTGRLDGAMAATAVDAIEPVHFRWKIGGYIEVPHPTETALDEDGRIIPKFESHPVPGNRIHAGFLAQEVKATMDAAGVDFGVWGLDDPNDPNSRQWLRPDQIIPVLWAALRETRAELKLLQ